MSDATLHHIKEIGPYGYVPNAGGAAFFAVVYAVECVALSYASFRSRTWWMLGTLAFGAALECSGNIIRVYSHWNPDVDDPYIAQQVLLVITPVLFAATHFIILTKLIGAHLPSLLSPIKPKQLVIGFVLVDVLSLIVQATGSGLAATAEDNDKSVSTINNYGYVVVAGLGIQLVGYLTFNALFISFWRKVKPYQVSRTFLIATFSSALLILGRSIFRTVEMGVGWIGSVATTEWCFFVFDDLLVASALMIFVFVSPPMHLPQLQASTFSSAESEATVKDEVA